MPAQWLFCSKSLIDLYTCTAHGAQLQKSPTFGLFPDSTLGTPQNAENASRYGYKSLLQRAPLVSMLLLTCEPPDLTPGGLLEDDHRAGGGRGKRLG